MDLVRQIILATGYQRPLTTNGCSLEDATNSLFRINTVACTIHLEDELCNEKLYHLSIPRGTIGEHSITICCSVPYLTIFQPYSGSEISITHLKMKQWINMTLFVAQSIVFCVVCWRLLFDLYLCHWIVCPSKYGFWLTLWYVQTFPM